MTFTVGSLVKARGREWVVLPESKQHKDMLVLRPLVGSEEEITGIYLPLEKVEAAQFSRPDPSAGLGNHRSCALLRDAMRLGFRSGAGPFRSLGRIAIEPRPYQLVPLLMALRLDPIRLLIADDVGVGKTVEACLIARELLDRGEIERTAVLCPPHLAEQWQRALRSQFHIDAALVLPGTVSRLEREAGLGPNESLFEVYPHVVVSMDYIKAERRRHEFLRTCAEFVIVDEAHTCASGEVGKATQQRHDLLQELAKDDERHVVLVTATPHSGKEETFRSLLGLLDPAFLNLPSDLSGEKNRGHREHLARHLVQRRRGDLENYLKEDTPFPEREMAEENYTLSKPYRQFLDKVLAYCRESVFDETLDKHHQRVRWWSALALLRSLASSPLAASATLRNRAASADTDTAEEADEIGRRVVLDQDEGGAEALDVIPGSQAEIEEGASQREKLLRLAREAERLTGAKDAKLQRAGDLVERFLEDGFSPIVFCRFIPTAEYVAGALRKRFGAKVEVGAVTGLLPPEERERRVQELGAHKKRILVCTDCLSEGINLQDHFDAVMHYDLSWNPTRHEQREGRVDRYGQPKDVVRTLTFYGQDNPVDGIVLEVLLRKHKAIHEQLGITVPVPLDTDAVVEAIFEGLMLREKTADKQTFFGFLKPHRVKVATQWDSAVAREKKSRTIFAQRSIKVEEVALELAATRDALGGPMVAESFVIETLSALGSPVSRNGCVEANLAAAPPVIRDAYGSGGVGTARFTFKLPKQSDVQYLTRTDPFVEALATYVWQDALDSEGGVGPARRCGVIRTKAVKKKTTLLLLRHRFDVVTRSGAGVERPLLAEEVDVVGYTGPADAPTWLASTDLEALEAAAPSANTSPDVANTQVQSALDSLDNLRGHLRAVADSRAAALLDAHKRVRKSAKLGVRSLRVEPHLPADILGLFVYLPSIDGGAA